MRKNVIDLTDHRFGKYTVLVHDTDGYWLCMCDCGNITLVQSQALRKGKATSCGCWKQQTGMTNSHFYNKWQRMIERCTKPDYKSYKYYGGKGVKVCERWLTFMNFYEDVKDGYQPGLTLDRYPNRNGDYAPDNFRWATYAEQNRNLRNLIYLTINGQEKCLTEWCRIYNIPFHTARRQLAKGKTPKQIFIK